MRAAMRRGKQRQKRYRVEPISAGLPARLRRSRRARVGQALLEYVLLLSMAAVISVGFLASFRQIMGQGLIGFNAVLEKELQTGGIREVDNGQIYNN